MRCFYKLEKRENQTSTSSENERPLIDMLSITCYPEEYQPTNLFREAKSLLNYKYSGPTWKVCVTFLALAWLLQKKAKASHNFIPKTAHADESPKLDILVIFFFFFRIAGEICWSIPLFHLASKKNHCVHALRKDSSFSGPYKIGPHGKLIPLASIGFF